MIFFRKIKEKLSQINKEILDWAKGSTVKIFKIFCSSQIKSKELKVFLDTMVKIFNLVKIKLKNKT